MPKLEISKVHDAYGNPGECPLCCWSRMPRGRTSGPSSIRGSWSRTCAYRRTGRDSARTTTASCTTGEQAGLGLIVHTHLQQLRPELNAALDALMKSAGSRNRKDQAAAAAAALAGGAIRASSAACCVRTCNGTSQPFSTFGTRTRVRSRVPRIAGILHSHFAQHSSRHRRPCGRIDSSAGSQRRFP